MVGYDNTKQVYLKDSFNAGVTSGIVTRAIITPLDVLKIRFQLQTTAKSNHAKYQNLLQASRLILKEEGLSAFWKGHLPAQMLSMSYGGIQFATFQYFTKIAYKLHPSSHDDLTTKSFDHLFCGSLSGAFATAISHPLDVLRTRFAAQKEPKLYTSLPGAFKHLLRTEGWKGFFRGLPPSAIQVVPYAGIQFASYSFLTGTWQKYFKDSSFSHLICGGTSGAVSKTACYPLDLLKKRLQVQGFSEATVSDVVHYRNFRHCAFVIFKTEGLGGFYKGWIPAVLKSCLHSGIIFFTYELFLEFYRNRSSSQTS